MIRVLIVDDHGMIRDGLSRLLATSGDIAVVATASSGEDGVRAARRHRPAVVVMDLEMPGAVDGIAATREILAALPQTKVLVLTSFSDADRLLASLDAGAIGYILKDGAADDLLRAVRAASRGEAPIDPKVALQLIAITRHAPPPSGLSAREREVLALVGDGLRNGEIARKLRITERTVKGHLTNIFRQIGVSDRTQAALWVREHGVTHGR